MKRSVIRKAVLKSIIPIKPREKPRSSEPKATFEGELYIEPLQRGVTLTQQSMEIDFESWLENWGFKENEKTPVRITIERL